MSTRTWACASLAVGALGLVGVAWHRAGAVAPGGVVLPRPAASSAPGPQGPAEPALLPTSRDAAAKAMPQARFRLIQVVVPAAGREGEALIAVDGLPPRTYRVGDTVVGAVVLQSVRPDQATLGPAGGAAAAVLGIGEPLPSTPGSGRSPATADTVERPAIHPASAPAVDRNPVPVTDPDHGVDTSNH